jgi:(p)ppGpp synthase/HD superfamily hydrolase
MLEAPVSADNKIVFEAMISSFSENDKKKIMSAYELAQEAHEGQYRLSGEPFFEHPLAVAAILINECHIKDASMICGALLHDVAEDTAYFGDAKKLGYRKYMKEVKRQITEKFSVETAEIAIALTEPPIDGRQIRSEKRAKEIKLQKLREASPEALVVKMADRLHNLRTFYPKEERPTPWIKVNDTSNLMPIFITAARAYPRAYAKETLYLLSKMGEAVLGLWRKYPLPAVV